MLRVFMTMMTVFNRKNGVQRTPVRSDIMFDHVPCAITFMTFMAFMTFMTFVTFMSYMAFMTLMVFCCDLHLFLRELLGPKIVVTLTNMIPVKAFFWGVS